MSSSCSLRHPDGMTAVVPAHGVEVAERAAPAAPARVAAVLAVLVALVGAVLGPTGRLDLLLGPDAVTVARGVVEQRVEGDWQVLRPGAGVGEGAELRAPDGTATLRVGRGAVDLAEGTHLTVAATGLRVAAGSVVVDAPAAVVGDGATEANGPGTWRWDATGRVGSYRGAVVVTDATDREVLVRPLEQVGMQDAVVTQSPRPYVYTDADPFDRQHLGTAIAVDDYVGALRRGLAADYGAAPQPPAFYTDFDGLDGQLVAALGDVGFDRVGPRVGPPADVLVAAVVTDALVVEAGLAPVEAADEVRTSRLAGAAWGLVAQARDLDAGDVRAAAERALARRQLAEQRGIATPAVPGTSPSGPTAEDPQDTPVGTTDPDGPDGEPAAPEPLAPGPSDPSEEPDPPEEDPGVLGSIVDETGADELLGDDVGGLVDDVVGAVDDALDGPDPDDGDVAVETPTEDVLDTTGDVVEGTVDTLEGTTDTLLGG